MGQKSVKQSGDLIHNIILEPVGLGKIVLFDVSHKSVCMYKTAEIILLLYLILLLLLPFHEL